MKTLRFICLSSFVVMMSIVSCSKNDTEETTPDFDQYNADFLAFIIVDDLTDVAPNTSTDKTWNNTKEYGLVSGHAIVKGSFSKESILVGYTNKDYYEYDNVSVSFSEYSDYETDPEITGNATMNGTLIYSWVMGNTGEYTGGWIFKGSVTCSGKYNGQASFYLDFFQRHKYSGSLTFNGTSYQVSSDL
ncbi:MAG: hypothetical protein K9H64_00695 [Bacteroidales bacterium]|nr:hypothetical protein [Bacteroidales bacterium]MCF8457577.1 hypothetical protein [Bacteroidales bacterium]